MKSKLQIYLPAAVCTLAILSATGCRSNFTQKNQNHLAQLYYSGEVAKAADYASGISEEEKDQTSEHALLWHLEAGNVNLDAGKYDKSRTALDRAEKLLYLFDGDSPRFNRPGNSTYLGTRSDRLLLHLLKGFNFLNEGKLEAFLVEIRRLRAEQFRYVLNEADPEIRTYEAANHGRSGIIPHAMKSIAGTSDDKNLIFKASGLNDSFVEYSQRRRPQLPLFYNPLAFYLSALGYTFDNEYEEAVIDYRYLLMLEPGNRLYRRDCAALIKALGDKLPDELKNTPESQVPDDQVVCVIVGRGTQDGWKSSSTNYYLPGKVPTSWNFSYPDYKPVKDPGFTVKHENGRAVSGTRLADLSEIAYEEYWQHTFPGMVNRAYQATVAMTIAHESAKAALVAALAMPNSDYKPLIVASARISVAATSRAYVNQNEWRRWITLPRSYSVAHIKLPAPGTSRKMTLSVNKSGGGTQNFELDFSPEANRAVVYARELGDGKFVLKKWENME